MKSTLLSLALLFGKTVFSQNNIDSSSVVWQISAFYGYYLPGADMVNRFGPNSGIGANLIVRLPSKWLFYSQSSFFFGNEVKEERLLDGIKTEKGEIIGEDGSYASVVFSERGFLFSGGTGRLLPVFGPNNNSGIIVMAGAGLLQHKIRIDTDAPQLQGDYKKGYDRLSNGFALTELMGYQYMSNNRMINFYVMIELTQAFTKNRRSLDFDKMQKDQTRRLDVLSGLKAGWVFPIYKRTPDEFYYH